MGEFFDLKASDFMDPFGLTFVAKGVGAINDALTPRENQGGTNQAKNQSQRRKNKQSQQTAQSGTSGKSDDKTATSLSIEDFVSDILETGKAVGKAYLDEYLPGSDAPAPPAASAPAPAVSKEWTTQDYAVAAGALGLLGVIAWSALR